MIGIGIPHHHQTLEQITTQDRLEQWQVTFKGLSLCEAVWASVRSESRAFSNRTVKREDRTAPLSETDSSQHVIIVQSRS